MTVSYHCANLQHQQCMYKGYVSIMNVRYVSVRESASQHTILNEHYAPAAVGRRNEYWRTVALLTPLLRLRAQDHYFARCVVCCCQQNI
jgi:hypothetical protein